MLLANSQYLVVVSRQLVLDAQLSMVIFFKGHYAILENLE